MNSLFEITFCFSPFFLEILGFVMAFSGILETNQNLKYPKIRLWRRLGGSEHIVFLEKKKKEKKEEEKKERREKKERGRNLF